MFAGNASSNLEVAAVVPKTGFETKIALKGSPTVVQLAAFNCGKVGKSAVFTL